MPKGPQGQKRPADVIGCVAKVARIATGEVQADTAIKVNMRKDGLISGKARAKR